tara:strand:- start:369 stop:773 length:405 start_codon:yes stop_codon:yes gene_type:complete
MINEDAPTMSAGNGGFSGSAAATGPVAGFDPLLGHGKPKKRKFKQKTGVPVKESKDRGYTSTDKDKKDNYLPYLICYDGIDNFVLYGRSPAEIKIQLRKIFRPEGHKKIKIKRLYPNEVIKFYWDKRQRALTNQ